MVPLNRWILAELPGTKIIGLIGGFFDPFGNSWLAVRRKQRNERLEIVF